MPNRRAFKKLRVDDANRSRAERRLPTVDDSSDVETEVEASQDRASHPGAANDTSEHRSQSDSDSSRPQILQQSQYHLTSSEPGESSTQSGQQSFTVSNPRQQRRIKPKAQSSLRIAPSPGSRGESSAQSGRPSSADRGARKRIKPKARSRQRRATSQGESSTQSGLQNSVASTHTWSTIEPVAESSQRAAPSPESQGRARERTCESVDSEDLADDSNLYEAIAIHGLPIKRTADHWIEKYKNDENGAILALLQFFVSSSGCTYRLTLETRNMESADVIDQMTAEEFHAETGEYPMKMSGPKWQRFRERFGEFLQDLVHQCRNSIIYDGLLLPSVKCFLIQLSTCQLRAFRHTATLAAMKLMTALVNVAVEVTRNHTIANRQLDTEKHKSRGNRSNERLETLTDKLKEFEENLRVLKENLHDLYTSVFVLRYIDVAVDIRVMCIYEMGVWMKLYPEVFITDKYLKYVGWNLFDKAAEVRLECIRALLPLYASESFKAKLEGFTSQFKPRMVAMVEDKDSDVAVEAVKLVSSLLVYYREFLTEEDCESIYMLVFSPNGDIAKAAGIFLKERLFTQDEEPMIARSRRGKQRLPNACLIRDLLEFFIESELLEHGPYLVDSLIDSNPLIKDWECMIDLLLEDAGEGEMQLSNKEETCLIDIMVCGVKQAATGVGPVCRMNPRKVHSKSELKQVQDDKNKLTEHFIPTLPLLLEKYRADPAKLENLLVVPQFFELTAYTTLREEQSLDSLLHEIKDIVIITPYDEVLEVAAKTLEIMCADDSPVLSRSKVVCSMLIDSLVDKYKEAILNYRNQIAKSESPGEDEMFYLVQSLKKVSIFYALHDMNSWNIQDSLFRDIEDAKDSSVEFPKDCVVYTISACNFSILWSRYRLMHPTEIPGTGLEDEARQLGQRLRCFVDTLKYFVESGRPDVKSPPEIRDEAYSSLCDLLVVFSNPPANDSSDLSRTLAYEVDQQMRTLLNSFIQERVFGKEIDDERDEESKIEELNNRRNLLAGYCKLVIYNVIATKWAADVFKHYVEYYDDYGDIIKMTIGKARSINKVNCALAMQHALNIVYLEKVAIHDQPHRSSKELRELKNLARKFALLFGLHAAQNRDALAALHRAGILFATAPLDSPELNTSDPPPNLQFLEILDEFTKKLLEQDKRAVLQYLNFKVQSIVPSSRRSEGEEWKPLHVYRNGLLHGATGHETATRNQDHVLENDTEDAPGEQSVRETKSKHKKRRAPKKNPLSVTKSTIPRGSKKLHEDTYVGLTPDSPQPLIEDPSQSSLQDVVDRIESLDVQSQTGVHDQNQEQQALRSHSRTYELYADEENLDSSVE